MSESALRDIDDLVVRLEGPPIEALVAMVVEHTLNRPLEELLAPEWVADQVLLTLDSATQNDATRTWIQSQVRAMRQQVPAGKPRDHLPHEVVHPLRQIVARPILLDRVLVGRLLDHEAARHLVTDILNNGLRGFAEKLKPVAGAVSNTVQQSRGFGRLKKLSSGVQTLGDGILGGMSRELEQRAEQKILVFVDDALHAAMERVADHLCDPDNAARFGDYRAHALDVLLDTDNRSLAREFDKLEPDNVVDVAVATLRAVSRREGLREELVEAVRRVIHENGRRTLRDWLREAGVHSVSEEEWRRGFQEQLVQEARVFVRTPTFREWLVSWLG